MLPPTPAVLHPFGEGWQLSGLVNTRTIEGQNGAIQVTIGGQAYLDVNGNGTRDDVVPLTGPYRVLPMRITVTWAEVDGLDRSIVLNAVLTDSIDFSASSIIWSAISARS